MNKVSDIFGQEGSDAWYAHDAEYFLPEGFKCPHCGKASGFEKETDIMDVWFDSGSSWAAVCKNRDYLDIPADVYLEGADQYRGWFQSSILTSVAGGNGAPYKEIITHGWTVDGEGRKMSKSLGNGISPQDVMNKYGADILRLWVASADYHADIHISPEILKQICTLAKEHGLANLQLSVERENTASIKTILRNGGCYSRSFKFGNEEADVYSINLSSGKQFELAKEPQASSHFMKKKSNVKER